MNSRIINFFSVFALLVLIYIVIDTHLFHDIIYHKDNRCLLRFYRKYLQINHTDKLGHFIVSGLIAFFLNILSYGKVISMASYKIYLGSFICTIVFTILELTHFFNPNRDFELLDLFFTYIGILILGSLSIFLLGKWIQKS